MRATAATCVIVGLGTASLCPADQQAAQPAAKELLEQTGIQGGLIVHVGCGDGKLTAALRHDERFVVQGLDRDPANVAKARERVRSTGSYGPISVTLWRGQGLPYADNLVNLLVVDSDAKVDRAERLRVLRPGGVAVTVDGGSPISDKCVKAWPDDMDAWTHYLYAPNNNAVSNDRRVGPPRRMQWVCGPHYARSHEINSSMAAMVSAGGRLFYIWDEGPTGQPDKRFPPKWSLIARDGFNGVLLWKRPMPDWGWRQWHARSRWDDPRERAKMLRHLPPTLPRRLVATDERIYVTLGYEAPVSALEASTGKVIRTVDDTERVDEILLDGDVLILRQRRPDSPPDKDVWHVMKTRNRGRVLVVDAETGRQLWRSEPDEMAPLTLAARGNRVYYSSYEQVVCLDRANGKELWRSKRLETKSGHRGTCGTLVAQDDVVLYAPVPKSGGSHAGQLHAFSAETGELLWTGHKYVGPGPANPPDLFVIDGLVWTGVGGASNLPASWKIAKTQRQGYDPLSGDVVREVSVPMLTSPGHHYRCYRTKATQRYLLLPKRGVEFLDLRGKDHMRHDWLRAPCIYGVLPANGMLYVAPHPCVCYQGVLMSNFNALTAGCEGEPSRAGASRQPARLVKGPAHGQVGQRQAAAENADEWPMHRHDPRRSGSVETSVAAKPQRLWRVELTGPITPPVVAGGRLLVAEKDAHTVRTLDAKSGRALWSYTVGARIDSPPTVHGGLVLVGSADGWVTCLRASDGAEVWRFRAAPRDRRIAAFGQVESTWPVHGSVVVQDDVTVDPPRPVVYVTAGRSTYLDGGISVYGLEPSTGKVLYETRLTGPRPDPFRDVGGAGYIDGAKTTLLVSDGADLYLHQERFRSDLKRFPSPMQSKKKEFGGYRVYPAHADRGSSGQRLIATRGFLDPSYNEGTYWTYGNRWPGWDRKMGRVPAYGQLLVFDDSMLYGVHVLTENVRVRRGFTPGAKGYRLFGRSLASMLGQKKTKDTWSTFVPVRVRAMVLAGDKLFIAGPPDVVPPEDPLAAFEGRKGAELWALSASDGKKLAEVCHLKAEPVYDGLIAAAGRLFVSTKDGRVSCFGKD